MVAATAKGKAVHGQHTQQAPRKATLAHANEPGIFERGISTVTHAMDGVAGVAGSISGNVNFGLFASSMAVPMALAGGNLIAGLAKKAKWDAPEILVEKAGNMYQFAQTATGGEVASHMLGSNREAVGNFVQKGFNGAARVLDPLGKVASELKAENIKSLPQTISNTSMMHTAMTAAWLTGSLVENYGVARNFGSQLVGLRQLQADLTGKELKDVSSFEVLTSSKVDPAVKDARYKLLALSGIRSLASAAGLAMIIKSGAIGRKLERFGEGLVGNLVNFAAWGLPSQIQEFAGNIIGDPVLQVYKSLSDAQKSGKPIDAGEYAQFLFLTDQTLQNRGKMGEQMAGALGEQLAAEQASIASVAAEAHNGKRKARIDALLNPQPQTAPQAPAEMSHVDKVTGKAAQEPREVHGKFTQKHNDRQAAHAQQAAAPARQ